MPPMTPPNAAAPPPAMEAPPLDPAVEKALGNTMQGLGALYMAVHKSDPEGPLADAVMSLQKAVAEVARSAGSPADPAMMDQGMDAGMGMPDDAAMDAEGMSPDAGMDAAMDPGMEMSGVDPEAMSPPGASIADAAGDTQSMMQDAAKRRLAG